MDRSNIPKADGKFSNAPYFNFNDDKLKFDTNDVSNANENYGSASALLPKSLPNTKMPSHNFLRLGITLLFRRTHPSAEHSTNFVNRLLECEIFLLVDAVCLAHQPDENTQEVELHTCLFEYW